MDLRKVTLGRKIKKKDLPGGFEPYNEIISYLEGKITRTQAVENIALPIEEAYDNSSASDDDRAWSLLSRTWHTFISFTSQISYIYVTHHAALAKLLVAIKRRDITEARQLRDHTGHLCQLWKELPLYDPAVLGVWYSPSGTVFQTQIRAVDIKYDTLSRLGGPSRLRDNYTNTNAFLAHLVHEDSDNDDWWVRALCAFCWALEDDDLDVDSLSLNIPGAAVWVLYAGELIWKLERVWGHPPEDRLAYDTRGTRRWPEPKKNGFCVERWTLWRDQFQVMADTEGVSFEAQDLASRAAEQMRWIESNVVRE